MVMNAGLACKLDQGGQTQAEAGHCRDLGGEDTLSECGTQERTLVTHKERQHSVLVSQQTRVFHCKLD